MTVIINISGPYIFVYLISFLFIGYASAADPSKSHVCASSSDQLIVSDTDAVGLASMFHCGEV